MPRSTITYRLAKDLMHLLRAELQARDYDENRLAVAILLLLSRRPYPDQLLFRDFSHGQADLWLEGTEARIYQPAQVYLSSVLSRPLTLANNLGERPTNMHQLYRTLARLGPSADGWPAASVARVKGDHGQSAGDGARPSFVKVQRVLMAQVSRLGEGFGEISRRRRRELGPIRLCLGRDAAEMAEEMSLWDGLAALPLPLERALDEDVLRLLLRVLESLNERYSLLRSCGLDPEDWPESGDLSVARLKDLKRLRRKAEALLRSGEVAGGADRISAYRQAFAACRGSAKRLAGYDSFEALHADHHIGGRLLQTTCSLDQPLEGTDGEPLPLAEAIADPRAESPQAEAEYQDRLLHLLRGCPSLRADPVLAYFAAATLVAGRPIHDDGSGRGLLLDPELRHLVDASARYPATEDEALLTAIESNLRAALRGCAALVA